MEEIYIEEFRVLRADSLQELADKLNSLISEKYNVEIVIDIPVSGEVLLKLGRWEQK